MGTGSRDRIGMTSAARRWRGPELLDPMARVRHMDELGVEIQVIHPSLMLVGSR